MGSPISKIHESVYLGTLECSRDHALLTSLGITHVVSVSDVPAATFEDLDYLLIPAADSVDQNLRRSLPSIIQFIQDATESNGIVLVHWCVFGFKVAC